MAASWSRRRLIGTGLGLGAGLALGGTLGVVPALADPGTFDTDVGIDPGHSPVDVGTTGNGIGEYQHTLDVALRLRPLLEAAGLRVTLTRTEQVALSPMNHPNPIERVRIEQAARIAAVGNARIYVSLHFD